MGFKFKKVLLSLAVGTKDVSGIQQKKIGRHLNFYLTYIIHRNRIMNITNQLYIGKEFRENK